MTEQGFATIPRSMLHDGTVPRDAKLVYLILSSHVGGNRMAWPSHRRIGELLGMSVSTVKVQLGWLREHGYIDWHQRRREDSALTTNEYILTAGSAPSPMNQLGRVTAMVGRDTADPSQDTATPRSPDGYPIAVTRLVNESQENDKESSTSAEPPRPEIEALCVRLADAVEANGSKRPNIGKAWLDAARLMVDRDGRTPEQIGKAIDWCQADDFWRANVMSMPKLRTKYDQLRLAAQRAKQQPPTRLSRADNARARGIPEALA